MARSRLERQRSGPLDASAGMEGVVNVAAPHPIPNREFMAALRSAYGRSFGLPAYSWMMEIGAVFLRTETELALKSRRVVPGQLLQDGFRFEFPEWPAAASELVDRWRTLQTDGFVTNSRKIAAAESSH